MSARPTRRERGSTSLELVLVVPALLAVLALLLAYGRQAQVSGLLENAARDGARTATLARSYAEADLRVRAVVRDVLVAAPASCRDSAGSSVGDPAAFVAGRPVTVRVWCSRELADVGLPLPAVVVTRSFTSPLDPYRGTR
jgi:Flp pilus assembly protein TadG